MIVEVKCLRCGREAKVRVKKFEDVYHIVCSKCKEELAKDARAKHGVKGGKMIND